MQLTEKYLKDIDWKNSGDVMYKDYKNSENKKYRVGWHLKTHILYMGYGQTPYPVETVEQLSRILEAAGLEKAQKEGEYRTFLETMQTLRDLSGRVYPDKFRLVCLQEGYTESRAMDMYAHFKTIVKGYVPYQDGRPLSDGKMEEIIGLARKADGMFRECGERIGTVMLNPGRWGDSLNKVLVVWTPKDGTGRQSTEMDLSCQDTFVTIGRMIENGNKVNCIIRQSDRIGNTSSCMSLARDERGKKDFNVFDGDVILAYLERPDFWNTDAKNCGLYLCNNGAYRRLLYTPGKGYVRKGIPDVDDELEIDIREGAFNSHILTMSQKWKKIGNVHVDVGFLIENNEK